MQMLFLIKSFFIGIAAVCGLGPIFLLTFNRSTRFGFAHGFVTSLGAGVGDGLLFSLGLLGVLQILEGSMRMIMLMDFVGGCLIIALGIKMLEYQLPNISHQGDVRSLARCWIKPFLLTIFNPAALVFFMMVSVQLIPKSGQRVPLYLIGAASCMVMLGSVLMLTGIAYMASKVGARLNRRYLKIISFISGICLILCGLYFLHDSAILLLQSI